MTRRLEEMAAEPEQAGAPFTLVLVDIDHFKQVNDEHGHDVGDQALVQFVDELRRGLRDSDLLGRWGGEEFLLLLPQTRLEQGAALAERLRVRIANARLGLPVRELRLSGSFGVAEFSPGEDLDQCLKRADEALYRAKALGRNRVERG
jgi:diguanylate cyclase (GGDEF)-like protein